MRGVYEVGMFWLLILTTTEFAIRWALKLLN